MVLIFFVWNNRQTSPESVVSDAAYVLFYQRRGSAPQSVKEILQKEVDATIEEDESGNKFAYVWRGGRKSWKRKTSKRKE